MNSECQSEKMIDAKVSVHMSANDPEQAFDDEKLLFRDVLLLLI